METKDSLQGWEFLGRVTAWSGNRGTKHELYGKLLFGKARYRLVKKDEGFDALVVKNPDKDSNHSNYSDYTHEANGRYFNFDE